MAGRWLILADDLTGAADCAIAFKRRGLAAAVTWDIASTADAKFQSVLSYDADSRGQSFGQVRNAFIRVVNQAGGAEIARYDLSEDASTETAMVFGELYRNGADWKFRAVGQGYASGLAGIAKDFGVNVG